MRPTIPEDDLTLTADPIRGYTGTPNILFVCTMPHIPQHHLAIIVAVQSMGPSPLHGSQ